MVPLILGNSHIRNHKSKVASLGPEHGALGLLGGLKGPLSVQIGYIEGI